MSKENFVGVIFCPYLRRGEAEALCKRSISNTYKMSSAKLEKIK
jgi:hypothetical protein